MRLIIALAIGLVSTGVVASAQQTTKEAKIEKILALTNSTAMLDQLLGPMKTMAVPPGGSPQERAQAEAAMTKILDLTKGLVEKLRPEMVKAYSDTFSEEEIDGMLAFYQSPAGRALLEKTPALTGKMMTLMQTQMTQLLPEILRISKEAAQPAPK